MRRRMTTTNDDSDDYYGLPCLCCCCPAWYIVPAFPQAKKTAELLELYE